MQLKSWCFGLAVLALGTAMQSTVLSQEKAKMVAKPTMGAKAADFELMSLAGEKVMLSEVNKESQVVLVVLRGFPGYQCPVCSKQVADLASKASQFASHSAKVLLVYPGPANDLSMKAKEFLHDSDLPAGFTMLLDPDYKFTNAYGLRWNAPNETAYPTTMVIDQTGTIKFVEISSGHGGRVPAATVLATLK